MRPETVVAAAGRLAWLMGGGRRRRVERLVRERGHRVLARRSLFPQTTGFELTLTVPADPDAMAVLRVEEATDPAAALEEAVAAALVRGDELRAMRGAQGEVVGLHLQAPWIAASFTRAGVASVAERLARWTDRRPVSVYVVPPGALPDPDPAVPLLYALSTRERAIALSAARSHSVVLGVEGRSFTGAPSAWSRLTSRLSTTDMVVHKLIFTSWTVRGSR